MFSSKLPIVFILFLIVYDVNGAKILGIFHMPSKSHHILGSTLLKALAARGHEVTMVSPYPFKYKIKNYRDIFLEEMLQLKQDRLQDFMKHNTTFLERMSFSSNTYGYISEVVLSNKDVQKLKAEKFDIVIQFAMFTECLLGLAHHFGASVILYSTFGSTFHINDITGNSAPPSYVPALSLPVSSEMTFLQRVLNTLSLLRFYGFTSHVTRMQEQKRLLKYFPEAPSLDELISNVSLVLLNSHYSIESPRPYVPNMIQIGGFHVEEPKELPPALKKFLDEATDGAIFFCLGSNVRISSLPSDKVQAIIKVLGELNMRVLFKSEVELPNLPKNIKIDKWLPQNDILAHPNLKLFVSHGGMLSTIEAVYHGVPVIGIPIFGDQKSNVAVAVANGYALEIDLDELNEDTFREVIKEVLTNSHYRDNIKLRSSLIRDQPIKPLDNAVFWVEHVIKYRGGAHLKNVGSKLPLYQYFLIDVFVFIAVTSLIILTILFTLFKKVVSIFVRVDSGRLKNKED